VQVFIDEYKLIGKFILLDIAHRALEVIRRESVSISYIGLTSLADYTLAFRQCGIRYLFLR
jgi:hypothetical protein